MLTVPWGRRLRRAESGPFSPSRSRHGSRQQSRRAERAAGRHMGAAHRPRRAPSPTQRPRRPAVSHCRETNDRAERRAVVRRGRTRTGAPNAISARGALARGTRDPDALLTRKTRPHRRAVELPASLIHLDDPSRVVDVIQWIGIKHDEIGALARRHRS
jgi:hypothetical protein